MMSNSYSALLLLKWMNLKETSAVQISKSNPEHQGEEKSYIKESLFVCLQFLKRVVV